MRWECWLTICIYIISNWYCNNISINIIIVGIISIVICNYNYNISSNQYIISSWSNINITWIININSNSNILIVNNVNMYCNGMILYIEVLEEYVSIYINNNISVNSMVLIIIISECIIIITVVNINNNCMDVLVINSIDGLIITNYNSMIQYINSNLSLVSNIIIYIWYNNNIYKCIVNYLDIWLKIIILVFIELQLKEFINYNQYMNECILLSIIFILLGIHLLHIIISSILINYSYSIVLVKLKLLLSIKYIIIGILISINVLIYWHLVDLLWITIYNIIDY